MTATTENRILSKSVRLTKAMRNDIVNNVAKALDERLEFSHRHGDIEAAFNKETRVLDFRFVTPDDQEDFEYMPVLAFKNLIGNGLVSALHAEHHRGILNVYNSMSEEDQRYFHRSSSFRINVHRIAEGREVHARSIPWINLVDAEGNGFSLPTKGSNYLTVMEDAEALLEYEAHLKSIRKIEKEFNKVRQERVHAHVSQTNEVVNSVNTTRQLEDIWPEVVNFLPTYLKDPSSITLPAILSDMSAVNQALS